VMGIEPIADKWSAFGWRTVEFDGHDVRTLKEFTDTLPTVDSAVPTVLIARTIKGKGVSFMESDPGWHLGYLGADDYRRAIDELNGELA
jgi:transketolase